MVDISHSLVVTFDGRELDDIPVEAVVEQHVHLPSSFVVTYADPDREFLGTSRLSIGGKVSIGVRGSQGNVEELVRGEITALEADIHGGGSWTVVRGYDLAHRLQRRRRTKGFVNATYDSVVRTIAAEHGIELGTVRPTRVVHGHIVQANEDDWTFVRRLAHEVGFDVGLAQGKLHFRPATKAAAAPRPAQRMDDEAIDGHALVFGSNLVELRAIVTSAGAAPSVEVRGWDTASAKPIEERCADTRSAAVDNGVGPHDTDRFEVRTPATVAFLADMTSSRAKAAAAAVADRVGAAAAEFEGVARGNAALHAGAAVSVGLVGPPFDGRYVLTATRHSFDPDDGYRTSFVVSAQPDTTLRGLGGAVAPTAEHGGLASAIVHAVADPERLGRVQLSFPWLDATYVSDWCRVAQPGAGRDRGFVILPEVADEVLVGFEHGDFNRPYVISGLHNGQAKAKVASGALIDRTSGTVEQRVFTSRRGHQLVFRDDESSSGIELRTGDGAATLVLDTKTSGITIKCQGTVTIDATKDVSIKAAKNVTIKADGGALSLEGTTVSVKGQGSVKVSGVEVTVDGQGTTSIKGNPVKLN